MADLWGAPAVPQAKKAAPNLLQRANALAGRLDPFSHVVAPALKTLGDALDFQRAAIMEKAYGKGSSGGNLAAARRQIGIEPFYQQQGHTFGVPWLDRLLTSTGRGAIDLALQTATDPLTYETAGTGALAKQALRGAARLVPEATRTAAATRAAASPVAREARQALEHAKTLGQDVFTYAGPQARLHGRPQVDIATALEARQPVEQAELERRLRAMDDAAMAGLNERERSQVQRILHGDLSGSRSSPRVWEAARQRRALLKAIPALQAKPGSGLETVLRFGTSHTPANAQMRRAAQKATTTPGTLDDLLRRLANESQEFLRARGGPAAGRVLSEGGVAVRAPAKRTFTLRGASLPPRYDLPPELQPFKTPGQYTPGNLRRDYFPAAGMAHEISANEPAREFNLLRAQNPHLLTQDDFRIKKAETQQFEDAFRGMLHAQARSVTAEKLKRDLSAAFGGRIPTDIEDLFTRTMPATGTERDAPQYFKDVARGVVNLPRIGIVGTSPRHIVNMANLLANAQPDVLPEAIERFTVLTRTKNPAERYAYTREAREMGLDAPFEDKTAIQKLAEHLPGPAHKAMAAMNTATWDFDLAATWSLARHIMAKQGVTDPRIAGQMARRLMVDYRHLSPFTKAARNVMPFGTFETQIPGAVFSGIARSPRRAALLNRASGGYLYGRSEPGKSTKYSGPTAKIGRDAFNPLDWARSGVADPLRLGAALLEEGTGAKRPFFNYYAPVDWRDVLGIGTSPIPYGRDLLDELRLSHFKPRGALKELLQSSSGINL